MPFKCQGTTTPQVPLSTDFADQVPLHPSLLLGRPPVFFCLVSKVLSLLSAGTLSVSSVDEAASRVLLVKKAVGIMSSSGVAGM